MSSDCFNAKIFTSNFSKSARYRNWSMARTPPELLDVDDAGFDDFSDVTSGCFLTSLDFSIEAVVFCGVPLGLGCLSNSTVDDELSTDDAESVATDSGDVLKTISKVNVFLRLSNCSNIKCIFGINSTYPRSLHFS